jgi:hypothetical protein
LCLFFRSFFFRLWVAIFLSLRFLPQGTSRSPLLRIIRGFAQQPVALVGIFVQAPLAPFIQKYPDSRAARAETVRFCQYETGGKKGQGPEWPVCPIIPPKGEI